MAPRCFIILCIINIFFITFSLYVHAVNFEVSVATPEHPGAVKFETVIGGIPYTKEIMGEITNYLWNTILKQPKPEDRKEVDAVIVTITSHVGGMAVAVGNKINVSAIYLNDYKGPFDLKKEFKSLMYHEMTHCFQWNGDNTTPVGVVEGIADYTILKADLYPPAFMPLGAGDKWDQGYDITARFFEYCDTLCPDFVAKLNNMMRKSYDVKFFQELTGKPVDQLWADYKAKYGNVKPLTASRSLLAQRRPYKFRE